MYKAAVAFVGSMLFLVVDYIPIPEGFTLQLLKFGNNIVGFISRLY
jgi:hypothetical protein